jgi:hypothetical protein
VIDSISSSRVMPLSSAFQVTRQLVRLIQRDEVATVIVPRSLGDGRPLPDVTEQDLLGVFGERGAVSQTGCEARSCFRSRLDLLEAFGSQTNAAWVRAASQVENYEFDRARPVGAALRAIVLARRVRMRWAERLAQLRIGLSSDGSRRSTSRDARESAPSAASPDPSARVRLFAWGLRTPSARRASSSRRLEPLRGTDPRAKQGARNAGHARPPVENSTTLETPAITAQSSVLASMAPYHVTVIAGTLSGGIDLPISDETCASSLGSLHVAQLQVRVRAIATPRYEQPHCRRESPSRYNAARSERLS